MKKLIIAIIALSSCAKPVMAQSEYSTPTIHIGVVVSDLDRSMDFYQNVMGMKKVNLYDVKSDFAQRSGLSGGIPFKAEVLKIEDAPGATEWKLMSFSKPAQHPQQKWIQDDTGMQYITFQVNSLKPFLERFEKHNVELLGETPTPLNEELSFVLVQDPDGTFVEVIGPR